MNTKNLNELSETELVQQLKKIKTGKIIDATIIGLTIGVVAYSAVNNGFSFFTFFPLIITYAILKNSKNNAILEKAIERELENRRNK